MHRVRFQPSGRAVRVPAGTTLLAAARLAGLPLAQACDGEVLCARCGLRILAGAAALGRESAAEAEAKTRNRVSEELRLACCAHVGGDVDVTTPYW